jgi:hypothetical protein
MLKTAFKPSVIDPSQGVRERERSMKKSPVLENEFIEQFMLFPMLVMIITIVAWFIFQYTHSIRPAWGDESSIVAVQ